MKLHELWISPARPGRAYWGSTNTQRLIRWGQWLIEPKYDGYRCIIIRSDGGLQALTRHGKPMDIGLRAEWFKEIPQDTVLDGEWTRHDKRLHIWDVPVLRGERLRIPLTDRYAQLERIVPDLGIATIVRRLPYSKDAVNKARYDLQAEGIVIKDARSYYPVGNTRDWLKITE